MQTQWLHRNQKSQLILFFAGWASNSAHFKSIKSNNFDVLMLNHYDQLNLPQTIIDEISKYKSVTVIGWSLGVWVANAVIPKCNITIEKSFAINGTLNPKSDDEGIPVAIFDGTLNGLSDVNLDKFNRRMFASSAQYTQFCAQKEAVNLTQLIKELDWLGQTCKTSDNAIYQHAIICSNDRIFPFNNQTKSWINKVDTTTLQSGHFPFYDFESWDDIAILN